MATKPNINFSLKISEIAAMAPTQVAALPHGELLVWLMVSAMLPDSPEVQVAFAKLSNEADLRRQLTGLVFGNESVGSDATVRYLDPGYGNSSTSATAAISVISPRAGTLRNMFVRHHGLTNSPNTVTYTVQINGVDTTLTTALAANSAGVASNVVNTVAVAQGDRITIKVTKSGSIGAGSLKVVASMEIA